ncbi:hypothetical protein AAT19DRAFT_12173 [Rhodotorula toruloides]|uniref:Uncharacterized protein n=1 Tax=Rhodotorula toruloides TaxID=5286 RepID=A0A2T0AFH3_RHOTO|nr:hypothetical protein AAT19DRAFT_12173 [Rhodotorula toruloides]
MHENPLTLTLRRAAHLSRAWRSSFSRPAPIICPSPRQSTLQPVSSLRSACHAPREPRRVLGALVHGSCRQLATTPASPNNSAEKAAQLARRAALPYADEDLTASVKAEHLRPELEALFFKYYEVKPPYYVPPPPFSFDPSLGPPEVVREPTIEESQERETYRGWLDVERRARFIKMMEEGEELAQQHGMRVREKEMRELERLLGNPQEAEHWAKLSAELEV